MSKFDRSVVVNLKPTTDLFGVYTTYYVYKKLLWNQELPQLHPLLKALNDEFDDSCSVDSDAETIVPFAPDSTPAQALDTINPNSLDTCTPVLNTASTTAPTVLSPVFTPNATNSIHVDTCTPVLGISSTSTPVASTELAPFDCDQCSSVFQDKMQLKAHLKKVHLNEKPYQCSECRRQFSLMIELQNHVNKFHQDLLLQGIS